MNVEIVLKPSPRNFKLMVVGQMITVLGGNLLRFALSLYVLDTTGRADIYATLYAVSSIPLLLSPIGGAIADRFNRRNLMVLMDLANAGIVLLLLLFKITGNDSILVIGLVMVLLSVVGSAETPTSSACIPQLVEENKIEAANGIISGVQALAGVTAPVLGGILYSLIGINNLIAICGLVFFFAAVMEIFIQIPFVKKPYEGNMLTTICKDLKAGLLYVRNTSFIRKSVILAALLNLVLTPLILVGVPIILRSTMESTDKMYGLGMGLINIASILGALSIGIFAEKMSISTLYKWIIGIGVFLLPMAFSVTPAFMKTGKYLPFILFFLFAVLVTMFTTIISVFIISKVQKITPNDSLGKVMAIMIAISQCIAPIGMIIYGALFEKLPSNNYLIIVFTALVTMLIAIYANGLMKSEK